MSSSVFKCEVSGVGVNWLWRDGGLFPERIGGRDPRVGRGVLQILATSSILDYALLQSFDRAIGMSLSDYRSCFKMEFMQCGGLVFVMFELFGKDASWLLSSLSSPYQSTALDRVYWIVTTTNYKIAYSEQRF
jgi:hypothetical protein